MAEVPGVDAEGIHTVRRQHVARKTYSVHYTRRTTASWTRTAPLSARSAIGVQIEIRVRGGARCRPRPCNWDEPGPRMTGSGGQTSPLAEAAGFKSEAEGDKLWREGRAAPADEAAEERVLGRGRPRPDPAGRDAAPSAQAVNGSQFVAGHDCKSNDGGTRETAPGAARCPHRTMDVEGTPVGHASFQCAAKPRWSSERVTEVGRVTGTARATSSSSAPAAAG